MSSPVNKKVLAATSKDASFQTESLFMRLKHMVGAHVIVASGSGFNATAQLQGSNDNTNWANVGSAATISTDGNYMIEDADIPYYYSRVSVVVSGGSATLTIFHSAKGH